MCAQEGQRWGSCRHQQSPAAIRLKPNCCEARLISPLQWLHFYHKTPRTMHPTKTHYHSTPMFPYTHRNKTLRSISLLEGVPLAATLTSHHHLSCWQPLLRTPGAQPGGHPTSCPLTSQNGAVNIHCNKRTLTALITRLPIAI